MFCFLEILKFVLCCEKESKDSYDDDDETYSRTRRPFLESRYSSPSERNEYLVYKSPERPTTPLNRDHYQIFPKSSLPTAAPSYYQTKVAIDSWISSSVPPQSPYSSKPPSSSTSSVAPQSSTNEISRSFKSSSPLPPTSSSRPLQSPSKQSASSNSGLYLSQSSPKPPPSSSSASSSSLKPPVPSSRNSSASSPTSFKPPQPSYSSKTTPSPSVPPVSSANEVSHNFKSSSPLPPAFYYRPLQSPSKQSASSSNLSLYLSQSSSEPPPSSSSSSPSSIKPTVPSSKPPSASSSKKPPAFKPILYTDPNTVTNEERKTSYICEKGTAIYAIPEDIKGLIKRDIVPQVLKQPLSPSTYKDYFAALLYAEDYYLDKWSNFLLKKVTLKLEEAAVYEKSKKYKYSNGSGEKDDKIFVAFEIDSVPEKRPFLLSRDMVYAKPSNKKVEPFQGFVYRVVKSNRVLVEFGDDFRSQHDPNRKYDVSFSFNRVCLKRSHQAVEAALDHLSHNFLFPECISRKNVLHPPALLGANHELNTDEFNAVCRILSFQGTPPYLLGGPLIRTEMQRPVPEQKPSVRTGVVVCEAVIEIYKTSKESRILICAPINRTCDMLMKSLMKVIPESDMFRANAAFREIDGVPIDILRSCPVKEECFECPPLPILREFKIIVSTFVSSFRLYNEGIAAGHFSHIFLVDASSTTEPEATIALANFANENTSVIVTGERGNRSGWVRSNMARKYGLGKSYFERLCEVGPYQILNPTFITELVDYKRQSKNTYKYQYTLV